MDAVSNLIKFWRILSAFSFKTKYNLREWDKTSGLFTRLASAKFAYLSSFWSEGRVMLGVVGQQGYVRLHGA